MRCAAHASRGKKMVGTSTKHKYIFKTLFFDKKKHLTGVLVVGAAGFDVSTTQSYLLNGQQLVN